MPASFDLDHLSVPLNCGSLTLSHVTKGWTGGAEERRNGVCEPTYHLRATSGLTFSSEPSHWATADEVPTPSVPDVSVSLQNVQSEPRSVVKDQHPIPLYS